MDFLEQIFGDEVTANRRIAVFTTPNRRTRFFADYQEAGRYAVGQAATQNVYFGVGLIEGNPKGRGKLENIAGIGGLWCDIDISGPAHPKENLPKNIEDAQDILAKMPFRPSIVVFSGHGLHAYWLLHDPWVFETVADRTTAASLAKRWHAKVCAIAAKRGWALENLGDLTRVLRLPGTLNHNGGEGPAEVCILENRPDIHYAVDDFEQILPADEPVNETPQVVVRELVLRPDAEPPALKLLNVASTSPMFWETWNRQRTDLADSSQSGLDLSLATIAAMRDWTDQEIANLIIAHRRHHGEKPEKALRHDYVTRTVSRARLAAAEKLGAGEGVDLSRMIGISASDVSAALGAFGPRAIATYVASVDRQQLEWLWPGRIPLGKLTLMCGDPGLGKSFVTLDMAARVSTGDPWPDTSLLRQPAGGVVLFNAEDDLADTIAPRLDRMGADDKRIVAIEGVAVQSQQRHFSLEIDLPRLEEVLDDNPDARLVVIDPVSAYCGSVDSHKNADVRGLLAPLANLASRRRVAIVCVTHLSKSGGNKAVYRAMGSLAFAAAAPRCGPSPRIRPIHSGGCSCRPN